MPRERLTRDGKQNKTRPDNRARFFVDRADSTYSVEYLNSGMFCNSSLVALNMA
jgi:hypothetical protein